MSNVFTQMFGMPVAMFMSSMTTLARALPWPQDGAPGSEPCGCSRSGAGPEARVLPSLDPSLFGAPAGVGRGDGRSDDVRLFHYTVWFRKRNLEAQLAQGSEVVRGDCSEEEFRGRIKQRFLDRAATIRRPDEWQRHHYPSRAAGDVIGSLPASDERYLEVLVELKDTRFDGGGDHDEDRLVALQGIEHKLDGLDDSLRRIATQFHSGS